MPEYPSEETWWPVFEKECEALYAQAGQTINWGAFRWAARTAYDIANGMSPDSAKSKHLTELRQALGIRPKPPASVSDNLVRRGMFFATEVDKSWTAVGCSDFNLLSRYLAGEEITYVLEQRVITGFNLLRVWTLFDIPGIGSLTHLDYDRIPGFVHLCANYGLYVEFTAYTGVNDITHWAKLIQAALKCHPYPLLELVNELDQNTNEPDGQGRIFDLARFAQAPTPLLSAHGSNGSQAAPVIPHWSYAVMHFNDASEWQRKVGHNSMEVWNGPTYANENTRFPDRCNSSVIACDAAAGAALLCAGSLFHSVHGKTSELWSGLELECAAEWARGAHSVPLEFQDGTYIHDATLEGPNDLRVYQRVLPDGRSHTVTIRK